MSADDDLWSFSLRVYGTEPVAAACLWLQDHHGVDVNLLLYCCWLGARGVELAVDELAAVRHAVSPWTREVVTPLRSARRWMKQHARATTGAPDRDHAALREQIKAAELEAERVEQLMLEQMMPLPVESANQRDEALALMVQNTTRYLASLAVTFDRAIVDRLTIVLTEASGTSRAGVAKELARNASATDERT